MTGTKNVADLRTSQSGRQFSFPSNTHRMVNDFKNQILSELVKDIKISMDCAAE